MGMIAKEAIQIIDRILDPDPWEDYGLSDKAKEALQMAIDALKKQIPMESLGPELGISPRHPMIIPCGNCGMELSDHMWDFCPYCGQKILWESAKNGSI